MGRTFPEIIDIVNMNINRKVVEFHFKFMQHLKIIKNHVNMYESV